MSKHESICGVSRMRLRAFSRRRCNYPANATMSGATILGDSEPVPTCSILFIIPARRDGTRYSSYLPHLPSSYECRCLTKKYLNIHAAPALGGPVIVRFEVLDKHAFATRGATVPKSRFKRAAAAAKLRPDGASTTSGLAKKRASNGKKLAGRSRKHISLTPQTFFLARARGRVFVFFRRPYLPFLPARECTLPLVAVPVFSGNIHRDRAPYVRPMSSIELPSRSRTPRNVRLASFVRSFVAAAAAKMTRVVVVFVVVVLVVGRCS